MPPSEQSDRPPPSSESPRATRDVLLLAAATLLTFLICYLVAADIWQVGVEGEWTWNVFERPAGPIEGSTGIVLATLLAIALALCLRTGLATPRAEWPSTLLILLLALGFITQLDDAGPFGPAQPVLVTAPGWQGGYYGEAVRVEEMGAYLANYADMIERLRVDDIHRGHIANHPPGPVLFHWLVNRFLDANPFLAKEWLGVGEPQLQLLHGQTQRLVGARVSHGEFAGIWAGGFLLRCLYWLTLPAIYLIARRLYDARTALIATALAALIPSLNIFAPYVDQALPFFAAWAFLLWHESVRRKSWAWAAGGGALLALGLMWSLALLLGVALIGFGTLLIFWKEWRGSPSPINWRGWAAVAAGGVLGFVFVCLLPKLIFDYDTVRVWKICLSQHAGFAVLFKRSHLPWLLFNPIEFLVFSGVPLSFFFLWESATTARTWWRRRTESALPLSPWALILVLAVVNVSGKNLGEVARLWMFLMPFAALGAARALQRLDRGRGWPAAWIAGLMAVQTLTFRLVLDVFNLMAE